MGFGEFGSNGSVHWAVNYREQGDPDHLDVDSSKAHPGEPNSTNPVKIGDGKPNGNHRGVFRITARYPTSGQAKAALQKALADLGASGTEVVLDVNLRSFQKPVGPRANWEIRVDW